MKKIFLAIFTLAFCFTNAQNFFSKEILFNQPNSTIVNGYFKNGYNVVLKVNTFLGQGQVISLSNLPDSTKLLDSFEYSQSIGFVFYEKNTNLFYERIIEDKSTRNVYLLRKNLTLNITDSLFLRKSNHYGVESSKIKKFGDTSAIQIEHYDSINASQNIGVNDFYIVVNNNIINTIVKPKYNFWYRPIADYYLMGKKLFITCNYDVFKLALYVHDLSNVSIDSSIYNFYKPFSTTSNSFIFNYTKINQKLYLINAYTTSSFSTYDSIILLDIGSGTSLLTAKVYGANGNYAFLSNSLLLDFVVTGNGTNAVINKIGANLNLVPVLAFNKTTNNKIITHKYFFENVDTQYACGSRYENSSDYATIEKIYPYKTGIQNDKKIDSPVLLTYPNPTQGYFKINLTTAPSRVVATSILGQQTLLNHTEQGFDTSPLANGLYIISFIADNSRYDLKLWVQK